MDAIDAANEKKIATVSVPKDELWARIPFNCSAKQSIIFLSKFSPVIWSGDEGKVYNPKRYWSLPESEKNAVAWNVTVCFPTDFAQVPMPPEANNKCRCDKTIAPPIKTN